MVEGCLEWGSSGLGTCDAVRLASETYRGEQDVLGRFVAERCIVAANAKTTAADVRDAVKAWCRSEGEAEPSGRKIGVYFAGRFTRVKASKVYYQGVGLLTRDQREEEPVDRS